MTIKPSLTIDDIARELGVPVKFAGVGEGIEDLKHVVVEGTHRLAGEAQRKVQHEEYGIHGHRFNTLFRIPVAFTPGFNLTLVNST